MHAAPEDHSEGERKLKRFEMLEEAARLLQGTTAFPGALLNKLYGVKRIEHLTAYQLMDLIRRGRNGTLALR